MTGDLPAVVRDVAIEHALDELYPDRRDAEVVDARTGDEQHVVGVKVQPRGYFSTAKYAVVSVSGDGRVENATTCDRRELDRRLGD